MAEFPAMPFWTDAYLADTTHLSTIEHGAYLLLMFAMWRTPDKCLPNKPELLARYCKLTKRQWQRIAPVLLPFFRVEADSITQGRLTDEAAFVRQHSAKQSDNAKARWLKNNKSVDAMALPDQCQTDAPTPTPTPTKKDRKRKPVAEPPEFVDFWNSVPKKAGRYEAIIAYRKAVESGADPPKVNAAAKRWRAAEEKTDEKYIALPATWLNKRRYEDYHAAPERESNLEYDTEKKEWRWKRGLEPKNP